MTSSSPCFFHSSRMYSASSLLRFDPATWGSAVKMRCWRRSSSGVGMDFSFSSIWDSRVAWAGVKPRIWAWAVTGEQEEGEWGETRESHGRMRLYRRGWRVRCGSNERWRVAAVTMSLMMWRSLMTLRDSTVYAVLRRSSEGRFDFRFERLEIISERCNRR